MCSIISGLLYALPWPGYIEDPLAAACNITQPPQCEVCSCIGSVYATLVRALYDDQLK